MLYIARSFVILQLGNVGSIIQNLIQSCLKVFLVGLPNNSWIFLQHFFCRILPLFGSCLVVVSMKFSFLLNLHPINPAKAEEKSSNALGSISAAPSQFAESQKLQGGNDELVNVVNNSDWATILCEASFLENVHRLMGSYCFSGS